ncbi:DUF58 domain-containing protein [Cerasicoccus arenae]|uniref:DUF58 domain-containing protein n=1 Tax=Cerasicoccus arenae TaxID=424488 RepID=A0A8J3GCA1_9BACT|nr:DUF58 domain-containing protein [Cerasicoccus arenae]MBK1859579.1 DUF58 domain-containing protein [Cerasicoccus arenae]GHB92847.1 hypothetical protein GCM10007047_05180 [Cerasicoccus arenae]
MTSATIQLPAHEVHRQALKSAESAARMIQLAFRRDNWRGQSGNWAGMGIGSSIDFQDHRQYIPGDDPRYINWQAYARTGNYSMKLYREEVSPQVDLAFDASASMFVTPEKALRALELLYFAAHSTFQINAQLKAFQLIGSQVKQITTDALRSGQIDFSSTEATPLTPHFDRVPWRQQSLRVIISDLLFPSAPDAVVNVLSSGRTRCIVFAPWTEQEANPDWLGNVELIDCERDARQTHNLSAHELESYRQRYRSHFAAWSDACRRRSLDFARVKSEGSLTQALTREALGSQAVEVIGK